MAKFRRYLISLVGLAAWAVSFAAPLDSGAGKTKVSAVWLPGQAPGAAELFVSPGGNASPQPLLVGGNGRGREVSLDLGSAKSLKLLARATSSQSDAPAWQPLGDVALPSGKSARYLLILAAPNSTGAVRGIAVTDDVEAFPVATVRLANFTGSPLMAKIGDKAASHSPGVSSPIPYMVTSTDNGGNVPMFPFALATEGGVFFNGRIDAWPGSRTLVLVVPNPVGGKDPVVKSLIDRPAPPSAPAK